MGGEKAREGIPGNTCKGQAEEEVVIEKVERPEAPTPFFSTWWNNGGDNRLLSFSTSEETTIFLRTVTQREDQGPRKGRSGSVGKGYWYLCGFLHLIKISGLRGLHR